MKNLAPVISAYNKRCSAYSCTRVYGIPIYKIPQFLVNWLCLLEDVEFVYQRLLSVTGSKLS